MLITTWSQTLDLTAGLRLTEVMSTYDGYQDESAREIDLFFASRVVAHKPAYTPGPEMFAYPITSTRYVNGEPVITVTGHPIGPKPEAYSDAALLSDLNGLARGPRNAAEYLFKLDTIERRKRAVSEAHTLQNIQGGIYSHNVSRAVDALLRAIEAGREDDMLYGEKFAHDAREAELRLRQATGDPTAIYYPKGLRKY